MKIQPPDVEYLEQASKLSEKQAERVLSRITGKLPRRLEKDKLNKLEAIALQLELEDEQLWEWREKMQAIREKESRK